MTWDEAEEVLAYTLKSQGSKVEHLDPALRGQALAGTINIVEAMQALGWKISRPLKLVGG
jgi:hypothetical protein